MTFVLLMAGREMRVDLAATAVLLRLRGDRRRRDRGAPLGDPEHAHGPDARGARDHRRATC